MSIDGGRPLQRSNYVIRLLERLWEMKFSIFHSIKCGKVGSFLDWDGSSNEIHPPSNFDISLSDGEDQNVLEQIIFEL